MTGLARSASAWIRRFQPADGAETRLICFPHAGGSASYYLPVARALSPAVDVLAVQYPGRQDRHREQCVDNIPDLADLVSAELGPWLDRPFALFGHSMGASLAFEVAARLARDGVTPTVLFASGRRAPSRHRDERAHLYDDDRLVAELQQLSGTDSQVLGNEEIIRMILPAVRNDYKAAETYRYRPVPPLSCPIVALAGDEDPKVTVDEARAWGEHTDSAFELRVYPGGHFFLNSHAAEVTALIADRLAGVPGAGERR